MALKSLKALDLFCGAGGASFGLRRAGFEVVGVDIRVQPRYPFPIILADAMEISWMGFDLVWASPPCQAYTTAQRIQSRDHPKLIDQVRLKLKESGSHYVIENVVGAPLKKPIELCGAMFGLKTYRHRLFETSFPCKQPWHQAHDLVAPQAKMGRKPQDGEFIQVVGNFSDVEAGREAMGINWMTRDELSEAIPPVYSEFIAREFMASMTQRTTWNDLSDFERLSCATKRRFKSEPPLPSMAFRAYHCDFCGGWHLASKYKDRPPAHTSAQ